MNIENLKKLAAVAQSLDSKGYFDESSVLDSIIEKLAEKAKKDYDGDGEVETSEEEWRGSRDKAIKKNKSTKKVKKTKKKSE